MTKSVPLKVNNNAKITLKIMLYSWNSNNSSSRNKTRNTSQH